MAMFMAIQIIKYPDKYKFSGMPETLKAQIATHLIDSGAESLIDEASYLAKSN